MHITTIGPSKNKVLTHFRAGESATMPLGAIALDNSASKGSTIEKNPRPELLGVLIWDEYFVEATARSSRAWGMTGWPCEPAD